MFHVMIMHYLDYLEILKISISNIQDSSRENLLRSSVSFCIQIKANLSFLLSSGKREIKEKSAV
ncbi:CLUMA_CG015563, isoform A [Clunio marinus]|uniref:CLUMA_CG015563, isoform A n=1 Tax=Clunio marinus TaxID=568069 RepID=A0A1J1IRM8_9DIPT|nr:CLUMA_CG015563, isoform A [Clunio marinus]